MEEHGATRRLSGFRKPIAFRGSHREGDVLLGCTALLHQVDKRSVVPRHTFMYPSVVCALLSQVLC